MTWVGRRFVSTDVHIPKPSETLRFRGVLSAPTPSKLQDDLKLPVYGGRANRPFWDCVLVEAIHVRDDSPPSEQMEELMNSPEDFHTAIKRRLFLPSMDRS